MNRTHTGRLISAYGVSCQQLNGQKLWKTLVSTLEKDLYVEKKNPNLFVQFQIKPWILYIPFLYDDLAIGRYIYIYQNENIDNLGRDERTLTILQT